MFLKIVKALNMSSSMVHNIIKYFWKSGEISVSKGQGLKSVLEDCYLWVLRRSSIKSRHGPVMEITAWAQEQLWKSLWTEWVIHKCTLKLHNAKKKKPYMNLIQKCQRLPKAVKEELRQNGKRSCGQTNQIFKNIFGSHQSRAFWAKEAPSGLLSVLTSKACTFDGVWV